MIAKELKLICYVLGLYVCFIYWGYLQEKLTSTKYSSSLSDEKVSWDHAFALNFLMALAAAFLATLIDWLSNDSKKVNVLVFAKAAITCAIASPVGYAALKYISFPLVILTKSSKPVPLIIIGVLFYNKKYTWYKYVSVALLCIGCVLFSSGKKGPNNTHSLYEQIFGIFLVGINLFLDGYTNNEQDQLFKAYKITGIQMMKYIS